ncbi:hypothetical protein BDR07DRAFT_1383098 [Suillus spraguei]|nr:hypothetical protein BDR07DRAFT_1383098 [Suillus spraguei]
MSNVTVINVFRDVAFVYIQNVISVGNPYSSKLNLDSPASSNKMASANSDTKSESESGDKENGDNGYDVGMKTEHAGPDFHCNLLVRRVGNPHPDPENPTVPCSYYVKKKAAEPDLRDQHEEEDSNISCSIVSRNYTPQHSTTPKTWKNASDTPQLSSKNGHKSKKARGRSPVTIKKKNEKPKR